MATNLIAYRFRNDDGTQLTASWKAAQNVAVLQQVDQNFRIRFLHQQSAAPISNLDIRLQYNKNAAGWVNVSATSLVVRSSLSPNVTDQSNLTSQLTGGTGTFQGATGFDEGNGICGGNSMDILTTGQFETEFCCQLRGADVVDGDTIQLRTINNDTATAWQTYTVVAEMTAMELTGVGITSVVGAAAFTGAGARLGLAILTPSAIADIEDYIISPTHERITDPSGNRIIAPED